MQQFVHYARLSDWEDDDVILVDIDVDEAFLRIHRENDYRGPMPIFDALDRAVRVSNEHLTVKRVGVHLRDGARWNDAWGKLIEVS